MFLDNLPGPLTKPEEKRLFRLLRDATATDAERLAARNEIWERNVKIVVKYAHSVATKDPIHSRYERDLAGELVLRLSHCIDRFDVERGYAFSTYLVTAMKWDVKRISRRYAFPLIVGPGTTKIIPPHTESPDILSDVTYDDAIDEIDPRQDALVVTSELLSILSPREQDVITRRFAIGCDHESLKQIAARYGITKERIRQVQLKAIQKLRACARARDLSLEDVA